jgi:putative NADH-flavin reductase
MLGTEVSMKVLVLGATGGVGRHVVPLAQAAGHEVTVLTRSSSYTAPAGVRVVHGEVLAGDGLAAAMAGQQAVLSSIGMQRKHPANPWSASLSPTDLTSTTARRIAAAMKAAGVPRIVAVSAGGVGDSAPRLNAVMKFFLATTMIGTAYRDLAVMESVYADSGLDWVAPRPTRLTNAARAPRVAVVESFGAFDDISRADVAGWMVAALAVPVWPDPSWGGRTPQISRG